MSSLVFGCENDGNVDGETESTGEEEGSGDGHGDGGGDGDGDGDGDCVGTVGCKCIAGGSCSAGLHCMDGLCLPVLPKCGDGNVDDGEGCDLGDANNDEGMCKSDCTLQVCGDGFVGPGEMCDDGNLVDEDECSNSCAPASCGDGIEQPGEECDDGNASNDDGCLATCVLASCGDGFVVPGTEGCDDGNDDEMDGCLSTCVPALTCKQIVEELNDPEDGTYLIDPDGEGGEAPFEAYCDMSSDGGGWTLLTWSGDITEEPFGLPYPGLASCPTLDCLRGSAGGPDVIKALFDGASEFGAGADPDQELASYQALAAYPSSGRYDYGDLAGLEPTYGHVECAEMAGFGVGTFYSITGDPSWDGADVYLTQALAWWVGDYSSEQNAYFWSLGVPYDYCYEDGDPPSHTTGTFQGTGLGPNILWAHAGSWAVFVR